MTILIDITLNRNRDWWIGDVHDYDMIWRNRCQYEKIDWFGSGYELLKIPCECGIKPPGFICYEVSNDSIMIM